MLVIKKLLLVFSIMIIIIIMLQIMGDNYKDSMLVALKVCQVLNDYSSLQLFFIVAQQKKYIARLKLHSCQCHKELKTNKQPLVLSYISNNFITLQLQLFIYRIFIAFRQCSRLMLQQFVSNWNVWNVSQLISHLFSCKI